MSDQNFLNNMDPLAQDIYKAVISKKGNACPIMCRLAWHASGTFDAKTGKGGSNGATMRFPLEAGDGANAGLSLARDLLLPVKNKHPDVSFADLWTYAGCLVIQFAGGPKIPFKFGRDDASSGAACPMNGFLPDADKGADHLRDVFYRMGFDDRDIVALSGAHTLGRCNKSRSGFEGPWTKDPYKFDNAYFKNLLYLNWRRRNWDGPMQYEDAESGELMMLPTDMCIKEDAKFREYVELYAQDEEAFHRDFASAYSRLLHFGHPCEKKGEMVRSVSSPDKFRAEGGAGRLGMMQKLWKEGVNVHQPDPKTGRTALHKSSLSGHDHVVDFLLEQCKLDPNVQDCDGDTALHDASRFGQLKVISKLMSRGANPHIKNRDGQDALACAAERGKDEAISLIQSMIGRSDRGTDVPLTSYAWSGQKPTFTPTNYPGGQNPQSPQGPQHGPVDFYHGKQASNPMYNNHSTPTSSGQRSPRIVSIQGQRVLITYATSAIGRACAFQFAEHGCQLLLMAVVQEEKELLSLAREIKNQSETYGTPVPPMELVVFSPKDTDMLSDLPNRVGPVDILVNNLEHLETNKARADAMSMVSSNLMSPMALITAFGPLMRQRGSGHIVSLCGSEQEAMRNGFSTMTQAALKAYMATTQREFQHTPVRITTVNIHAEDDMFMDPLPADPQDIADQILFAVTRPRHVQLFSMSTGGRRKMMDNRYWQDAAAQQGGPPIKNTTGWFPGNDYQHQQQMDNQRGRQMGMSDTPAPGPKMENQSWNSPPVFSLDGRNQYSSQQSNRYRDASPNPDKAKPLIVQNMSGQGQANAQSKGNSKDLIKDFSHPFAMETTPPPSPRYQQVMPGQIFQA